MLQKCEEAQIVMRNYGGKNMSIQEDKLLELKDKYDKLFFKGLIPFVIGAILLIVTLVVGVNFAWHIILVSFFAGFALIAVGLYFLYKGKGLSNIIRSAEIILQIEPDELIITEDFVVGRKGDVYLLTKRSYLMLALLRFNDLVETNEKKIRVKFPKFQFGKRKEIAGMKVHYSRGRYTIPIAEDKFATGEAVMYSFETETELILGIPMDQRPPKEKLMALINELKQEII